MAHFTNKTYADRLNKVRSQLASAGCSLLIVPASTDLEYLTGLSIAPSERFLALILPLEGDPKILCPSFEAERVLTSGSVAEVGSWEEEEDPFVILNQAVGPADRIALGAETPFGFFTRIRTAFPESQFVEASPMIAPLRARKGPEEVEALREALRRTRSRILEVGSKAKEGQREASLSRAFEKAIVLFGSNAALPHGTAGDRCLAAKDVILIDAGERVRGYWSDITRTFLSKGDGKAEEIWRLVGDAQEAAFRKAAPGVPAEEIDRAAREVLRKAGYGDSFVHRTGHGIGLDGHEPPYIVEGNREPLEPGMTFTIEPGVYLPGEIGLRIEDVFMITENGCEPLSDRDLEITYRQ